MGWNWFRTGFRAAGRELGLAGKPETGMKGGRGVSGEGGR